MPVELLEFVAEADEEGSSGLLKVAGGTVVCGEDEVGFEAGFELFVFAGVGRWDGEEGTADV